VAMLQPPPPVTLGLGDDRADPLGKGGAYLFDEPDVDLRRHPAHPCVRRTRC
jgi:hypothetical protein